MAFPAEVCAGSPFIILSADLIPATLMLLACMYGPTHALDHHHGPIVLLVLLGALLVRRFES